MAKTYEEKFLDYHAENPHVYECLAELAHKAFLRGHKRIGMWLLIGHLRWETEIDTDDPDPDSSFKINNNYAAHYSRMIMENEPGLDGLFETREKTAE